MKNTLKATIPFFIIIFSLSCYAQSAINKKYNAWLNQSKRYILIRNAIVCKDPKVLANLYDAIMQRNGRYSNYDINTNVPNCEAHPFWRPAHVTKTLYGGKIFKINYLVIRTTDGKINIEKHKNMYAVTSQVLDQKHYESIFIN